MKRMKFPGLAETAESPGWAFWFAWVLANSVGWIVGMSLAWLLSEFVSPLLSGRWMLISWAVGGMIVGINFGINQWFLIRPMRHGILGARAGWWVLATVLGWTIGLTVVIGMEAGARIGFTLVGLVIGLSVGIPQTLVFYTRNNRGWLWVFAHTAAWMIGLSAIEIIDKAVGFAVAGLISGAIGGGALIWLVGRRPSDG